MTTKKATKNEAEMSVTELSFKTIKVCVLGKSPLIFNAMSEKAWHELLMPSPKKNAAEKAASMKHRPYDEYRASTYQSRVPHSPSLLNAPAAWFKKALAAAALDMPGASKAQIGRLVWVNGDRVDIFGTPQILCAITRSADMARTPDVRTRAILPEWACMLEIQFSTPILKDQTVVNLLAAAGMINGVGDWRQQKGSGSYGQFELVGIDNPDYQRIIATQARKEQEEALAHPKAYDEETERLLAWFDEEVQKRHGKNGATTVSGAKVSGVSA